MENLTSLAQLQRLTKNKNTSQTKDLSREYVAIATKQNDMQNKLNSELGVGTDVPQLGDHVEDLDAPPQTNNSDFDQLVELEENILDAIDLAKVRKTDTDAVGAVMRYGNDIQTLARKIAQDNSMTAALAENLNAFFSEAIEGTYYEDPTTASERQFSQLLNVLQKLQESIKHSLRLRASEHSLKAKLIKTISDRTVDLLKETKASKDQITRALQRVEDALVDLPISQLQQVEREASQRLESFVGTLFSMASSQSRSKKSKPRRVDAEEVNDENDDEQRIPPDRRLAFSPAAATAAAAAAADEQEFPQPPPRRRDPVFDFFDDDDDEPSPKPKQPAAAAAAAAATAEPEQDDDDDDGGPFGKLTEEEQKKLMSNDGKIIKIPDAVIRILKTEMDNIQSSDEWKTYTNNKVITIASDMAIYWKEKVEVLDSIRPSNKNDREILANVLLHAQVISKKYPYAKSNIKDGTERINIVIAVNTIITKICYYLDVQVQDDIQQKIDQSRVAVGKGYVGGNTTVVEESDESDYEDKRDIDKSVKGIAFLKKQWAPWMAQDYVNKLVTSGHFAYFPSAFFNHKEFLLYTYGTNKPMQPHGFSSNGIAVIS